MENNLEVENKKGTSGSKEEDYKQRDIASIVKKMKKLSLSISEPQLSESQIEMSDQEQEDEVLALKAIYGDDMLVFEREVGSRRAFKISIHVEIPENIDITMKLPPFSNGHEPSGTMSRSSLRDNTLAGNTYTFRVQHLPPIVLTCVLPKSYPFYMPPQFTILAYWLDSGNICKLCNALDNIWSEDQGQVVLYKWAEWLRSSSLPALGFNHEVLLDPYGMQTKADGRAISGCSSPNVDIPRLMQYNDEKNNEVFCSTFYMCNICFTEYPGTEFVRLKCQHFFCWKCMEAYSHVLVRDGTVNKLNCPDPKCGASIPPGLLKRLLGDETFERWESLLLQKTLDSMTDVAYCPRCEAVCLEDEDNHAQCPKCFYSFCSLCRDRRHVGQTCMTPEMRLRILQERQSSSQLGSEQRKREQELINELLSVKQILRDAKQCPSCKMAISKTEGCNKMICYNCGQYFCYRCNEAISGYDHFSGGSCVLFEQEEIQNWERAMNDRQLQGLAQVELWPQLGRPCPNCGQMNVKQGNNNHIFCWSCQNHFCALCHKVVRRSSDHYGPRGCKQHTAD
uniref:RBR-type E3 ubiquitin transferase n=1 Tax=Araucaria cunninghamii TaxID=56994 RepID=A0A0D6R6B6_ARACU